MLEYCRTEAFVLNSLPYKKILDWLKLKAFADDKLNIAKMVISPCDRGENIVGKGDRHFPLFLQCFQSVSSTGPLEVWIVW